MNVYPRHDGIDETLVVTDQQGAAPRGDIVQPHAVGLEVGHTEPLAQEPAEPVERLGLPTCSRCTSKLRSVIDARPFRLQPSRHRRGPVELHDRRRGTPSQARPPLPTSCGHVLIPCLPPSRQIGCPIRGAGVPPPQRRARFAPPERHHRSSRNNRYARRLRPGPRSVHLCRPAGRDIM